MSHVIERPALIQRAKHLLRWSYNYGDGKELNLKELTPLAHSMLAEKGAQLNGPTGMNSYAKSMHCMHGVQLSVDLQVSQDMERSTIACKVKDIPMLAESTEIVFADPSLPSVLIVKAQGKFVEDGLIFVIDEKDDPGCVTQTSWVLALPLDRLDRLLEGNVRIGHMTPTHPTDGNMEPGEDETMRYMSLLCLKSLAFAQIPQFKPVAVRTHAERKAAGLLAGDAQRPVRPAFVVRYLPRIIEEREKQAASPTGKTHRFLGRAGHIRHFTSEKFTKARGTWKYIAPTPAPDGVKVKYVVRHVQPTLHENPKKENILQTREETCPEDSAGGDRDGSAGI